MNPDVPQAVGALRETIAVASKGLIDREVLVELVVLSAVARQHVLVIGPPGTAKSEAVRRISRALGGTYFEYLLGRFTEPSEIFGPVDLRRLKQGEVAVETRGMLPEAEIVFLDEVFRGSTAILNTLLSLLNERRFKRGHTDMITPLKVCVGAANELPDDPSLAAFADRFLVHVFVESIADPQLDRLLAAGWELREEVAAVASAAALDIAADACLLVNMEELRPHLSEVIRTLRFSGIELSDRRVVQSQRLVAAATVLAGREVATRADLWPLLYTVSTAEAQAEARILLRDMLDTSENIALVGAAEDASAGPKARATRLVQDAELLLENEPTDDCVRGAWLRRLEGVMREVDAGFAEDAIPPTLAVIRTRVQSALEG